MNRDVTMSFRLLRPHCFLTKKSKDRGRKELSKINILSNFDVFSILKVLQYTIMLTSECHKGFFSESAKIFINICDI